MPHFTTTIEIQVPAACVWPIMADVCRWPDWTPTFTSIEALDGAALAPGARFRVRQPRLLPAVFTVSELAPGARFEWLTRTGGVRARADHRIEPRGEQACAVTLTVEFSGLLAPLVWRGFGKLTREYVSTEAAALRRAAEAMHAQAAGVT